MSTVTLWNPFRELDEVQNRLNSFFGAPFSRLGNGNGGLKLAEWSPPVDIVEDEEEYLVKADLPENEKGRDQDQRREWHAFDLRRTQE